MDYRTILATGFLLLCGAVFVHSLNTADAFPQGPQVSLGSNPIDSGFGYNSVAFVNNSATDFVVTDLNCSGNTLILIDGVNAYWCNAGLANNLRTGLTLSPSSTIQANSNNVYLSISGYYTH